MRIAFAGSHRVGKSTLVERVVEALPGYTAVDEPYYLLEEEGYECSDPPSIEDFEAQLDRSWLALEDNDANVLFDRCPADVLAYLLVHDDAALVDAASATERAREAMKSLDLIVFVPIEANDRIPLAAHEDRRQRRAVDEKLRELLIDEAPAGDAEVLTVHGDVAQRVRQIMARIAGVR